MREQNKNWRYFVIMGTVQYLFQFIKISFIYAFICNNNDTDSLFQISTSNLWTNIFKQRLSNDARFDNS